MTRSGWIPVLTLLAVVAIVHTIVRAQQAPAESVLTGVLTSVWGDPRAGDPQQDVPRLLLQLTDAQGTTTPLRLAESVQEAAGGLRALDGRQVSVTLVRTAGPAGQEPATGVRAIRLATPEEMSNVFAAPEPLTGPQPRALILCRFSDSAGTTPKQPSYFTGLIGATWPGLNDYWWEVSYNNIDLNGTAVYGWYTLPNPRSYYVYDRDGNGSADLDFARAANDCTAVADADVYFPNFTAIDLNFNQDLDCCAWGGRRVMTLDGVSRTYGMTWMPPWSQEVAVYAHESGHSLGFPHSSGPYGQTYDSKWDPMSSAWGSCRTRHPTYGCVPVHTIMFHKDLDLWIPASRRFEAPPGSRTTIVIERSALPDPAGYLFAKIPIGASTTHYYTVEARRFGGYDNEIPGQGIVIHDVLTTRGDRVAQVIDADNNGDPNDAGAMWTPGESFVDAVNGITVTINSQSSSGYSVTIARDPTIRAVSVSPNAGTGLSQVFTLAYSDSAGVTADLSSAQVRFAASNVAAGSCTVRYNAMTGAIALQDNAGTAWLPGTLGSGTLANNQCTVSLATSAATPNGTDLTLVLDIAFSETFGGDKNVYMMARSAIGPATEWRTRGTWTVPLPTLSAISATPNAGSGITQTFTLAYSDSAGVEADLNAAQVRFTNIATGTTCVVHYRATTAKVRMQDDAGVFGSFVPFGSGTLANSRCTLNLASSSATPSGDNLTLTLNMTFAGAFSGPADIAMRAVSLTGPNTGWVARGTWIAGAVLGAVAITPNSGTGLSRTFVANFTDSLGVTTDLKSAQVRIGTGNTNACVIQYNAMTNKVRLLDNAGGALPFVDFGSGSQANSQCTLDLTQSSAAPSGTDLVLTVRLTFTASFVGTQPVSLRANSNFGTTTTGFIQRGTWDVGVVLQAISVSPNTGSGTSQIFTLAYSDSEGVAADLKVARVRFKGDTSPMCVIDYNAMTNLVRIQNDAGVMGPFTPFGGAGTLSNSQCILNLATSSALRSATDLTLALDLEFTGSFSGAKTIAMRVNSKTGLSTGFVDRGTWAVP